MHLLETYLHDLNDIRSTGAAVEETSYYPPLANLLNAVGQTLKPRVRCVMNLKNQGAGMPDGGLFTPDQFQRGTEEPLDGQPPAPPTPPLRAWARRRSMCISTTWPSGVACHRACGRTRWAAIK